MGELFIPMNPTDRDDEFGGIGKELGNHNIPCSNYHVADMGYQHQGIAHSKISQSLFDGSAPPPDRLAACRAPILLNLSQ